MNIAISKEDIPELLETASKGSDEELRKEILESDNKEQSTRADNQRIKSLQEGKVARVTKHKEDNEPILILECPFCNNQESYGIYDESLELIPDYKGEFLGAEFWCIKCGKEYKISTRQMLKALAESDFYKENE